MGCFSCFKPARPAERPSGVQGTNSREIPAASKTFMDTYTLGKKLGEGAFSTVKEAKNNSDNQVYAVKIIKKNSLSSEDTKGLRQEIGILREIDHPHIIKLFDIYDEAAKIYLVTEIMAGGELFDRIVQKEHYNEAEARQVSTILLNALGYCHERSVAHRDLKPENLLLASRENDNNLKIADFGFAKKCKSNYCLLTQCGTPGYVAPEIISGIPYGTQSDMWSLGVIMYILLVGYPPFNGANQRELFRLIKKGRYEFHEAYWKDISKEGKDLVSKLLVVDPKDRLTASQAMNSSWLKANKRSLEGNDLQEGLVQFRKFNAKRKLKHAVYAAIAANKMSRFVGLGTDQTFVFTQAQGSLVGCEPMNNAHPSMKNM
jgi:serine/threonine protein kinase